MATAPTIPQPQSALDVVGAVIQAASNAIPAGIVSFAQVFQDGDVPSGSALCATIAGASAAAQMDVKSRWPDGSVKMAIVSVAAPAIAAGGSVPVMLSLDNSGAPPAPPINLVSALAGESLSVSLSINGAASETIDGIAALQAALANGTATIWLSGSEASEARVFVPVSGSLQLVFDITMSADGRLTADIGFDNDIAMGSNGGTITYSETTTLNGAIVSQQSNITQAQYQNWDTTVSSDGVTPSSINVQHDVAYLEATGAVANYDLTTGISDSLIDGNTAQMASAGWGGVLASNDVTQYMPQTGARPDIGPTTQANTIWLLTQNAAAATYALGQAETSGAIPWNFYDQANGVYLNTQYYPDLWIDPRSGNVSPIGLTQAVSTDTGWTTDPAHQPDLSYDAYLLTGQQVYLDGLNAQASFAIMDQWQGTRLSGTISDNVINGNQVRGAAWDIRQIDEAAWANPDGSAEKAYYTQVMNDNWSWLVSMLPIWTQQEGAAYGYVPSGTYGSTGAMPEWQQDYFASSAIEAAEQGNTDAVTYLQWASNFLVGRFLNAANGFNPRDGVNYNLMVGNGTTLYQSWAAIEQATENAGLSNGSGWAQTQGDYAQLGLQTLAGLITVTEDPDAIKAYGWLIDSGAPFIDQATFASDPTFNIVPRLPDGNLLTAADVTLSQDTTPTRLQATTADALIEAGSGNDTIVGGSGVNLLFAGAGNDLLLGGASTDFLYGGSGSDTLSGGAGANYLDAGTGATTFLIDVADQATDTIADFNLANDKLQIVDANGALLTASAIATLLAGATADSDGDAVLTLSGNHSVTLLGIAPSALSIALFVTGGNGTTTTGGGGSGSSPYSTRGPAPQYIATNAIGITAGHTPQTYILESSRDLVVGTNYLVTVQDTGGSNTVVGGSGGIVFASTAGKDIVQTLAGSHNSVQVGQFSIVRSAGQDTIYTLQNGNTVRTAGNALITDVSGAANSFVLSGHDTLNAGGADSVTVDGGQSTIIATGSALSVVEQQASAVVHEIGGGDGEYTTVTGGAATITGGAGQGGLTVATSTVGSAITITGGHNTIETGGADTITAVSGLVIEQVANATPAVLVAKTLTSTFASLSVANAGSLSVTGGNGGLVINLGNASGSVHGTTGALNVTAGSGNVTLVGGQANDTFTTGSGNATVIEGAGNDYMSFGSGTAMVTAGSGHDSFLFTAGMDATVQIDGFSQSQDTLRFTGFNGHPIAASSTVGSTISMSLGDGTHLLLTHVTA